MSYIDQQMQHAIALSLLTIGNQGKAAQSDGEASACQIACTGQSSIVTMTMTGRTHCTSNPKSWRMSFARKAQMQPFCAILCSCVVVRVLVQQWASTFIGAADGRCSHMTTIVHAASIVKLLQHRWE